MRCSVVSRSLGRSQFPNNERLPDAAVTAEADTTLEGQSIMRFVLIPITLATLIFSLAPVIGAEGHPLLSEEKEKQDDQQGDKDEARGDDEPECE